MCAVSAKPVAHVRLPVGSDFGQLRAGLQIRYLSPVHLLLKGSSFLEEGRDARLSKAGNIPPGEPIACASQLLMNGLGRCCAMGECPGVVSRRSVDKIVQQPGFSEMRRESSERYRGHGGSKEFHCGSPVVAPEHSGTPAYLSFKQVWRID